MKKQPSKLKKGVPQAPAGRPSKCGRRKVRPANRLSSITMCYIAYSDGKKMIYTQNERAAGTHCSAIPDPRSVTFSQLFINGVLQPVCNYRLAPGKITLLTAEAPLPGAPIILQSVVLRLSNAKTAKTSKTTSKATCSGSHRGSSIRKKKTKPRRNPAADCHERPSSFPASSRCQEEIKPAPPLIKTSAAAASTITGTIAATTGISVVDAATRLNATVTAAMINAGTGTTFIPAASFMTDEGTALNGPIPAIQPGGFYNLFINGVLQQSGLSALGDTGLTIASADILPGTPVNLELHDYSGTTSTSTAVPLLTVSTEIST